MSARSLRSQSLPCAQSQMLSPFLSGKTLESPESCARKGKKYRRPTLVRRKRSQWKVRTFGGGEKFYHSHKDQWERVGGCYTYNPAWNDAVKAKVEELKGGMNVNDPSVILPNAVDASKRLSPINNGEYTTNATGKNKRQALLRVYKKRQERGLGVVQSAQNLGTPTGTGTEQKNSHFYYF